MLERIYRFVDRNEVDTRLDFRNLLYCSSEDAMRDFMIRLKHRPGELARVTNALAFYGVNIKSVAAMAIGDQAMVHIIPDDADLARTALQVGNVPFQEQQTAIVKLENRVGILTAVAAKLGESGVNLSAAFVVGTDDDLIELAIVTDNLEKAKQVLE